MDQNNPAAGQKRAIDVSDSPSPSIQYSEFIYYNLRMCVGDPRSSQTGHQGSDGFLLESHYDGR